MRGLDAVGLPKAGCLCELAMAFTPKVLRRAGIFDQVFLGEGLAGYLKGCAMASAGQ